MSKPKFITQWFYASVGKFDDVQTTGWFWNRKTKAVQKDEPRTADYQGFSDAIEKIYNDMDEQGYDVHQVIPLALGATESTHARLPNGQHNYLGEVGFSVTRGAVVVGKLR